MEFFCFISKNFIRFFFLLSFSIEDIVCSYFASHKSNLWLIKHFFYFFHPPNSFHQFSASNINNTGKDRYRSSETNTLETDVPKSSPSIENEYEKQYHYDSARMQAIFSGNGNGNPINIENNLGSNSLLPVLPPFPTAEEIELCHNYQNNTVGV